MVDVGRVFLEAFTAAIEIKGIGDDVLSDSVERRRTFQPAPASAGPWEDEELPAPLITATYSDLTANSLWPLDDPEITINGTDYRAIAHNHRDGLVDIYLQEA